MRGKSFSSSLRKVLGDGGDIAQKFWGGFQIPVGGVDVDVAKVGRQCQHVLPDSLTTGWR